MLLASGGGHERIAHACGHEAKTPSLEVEVHEDIFVAGFVHQVPGRRVGGDVYPFRGEARREDIIKVAGQVIGQDLDTVGRNPKAFDLTVGRLQAFEPNLCRWSGAGRTLA